MAPKVGSEPADDWPLPEQPYLPGRSPRPDDDDDVHRIARAAPNPTDPAAWQSNLAWLAGLRLYRHRYFWEAHEVWEPVWMNARPNSRERTLVQGTIQLANSGLKLRMEQIGAARRLAVLAAGLIEQAGVGQVGSLMGLDVAALAREVGSYVEGLAAGGECAPPRLVLVAPTATHGR